MPIPNDILTGLGEHQAQIWQTVSRTATEACGKPLVFGDALTLNAKTSELFSEFSAPMVVILFAFTSMPENPQALLIPQDAVEGLAGLLLDKEGVTLDENTLADIRPTLEALVQGVCLSVGAIQNDAVVASGLTIRHQLFNFPPSMQRADELIRVQIAITAEEAEFKGVMTWLLDSETAHMMLGIRMSEDESDAPFQQVDATLDHTNQHKGHPLEDVGSIDMLMDIPLEISVELGRMKMLVKDVVDLGTGSVVEIEKAAGEPVDVLVNGRLVARGEVVVIEDNFGVRITEILNPHERLQRLNDAA